MQNRKGWLPPAFIVSLHSLTGLLVLAWEFTEPGPGRWPLALATFGTLGLAAAAVVALWPAGCGDGHEPPPTVPFGRGNGS